MAGSRTMTLAEIKDMLLTACHDETVARPFPSGVAPGDDRGGYLNASEAGLCTRRIWYGKHEVAGEDHRPHGVFARGHAAEHYVVSYLGVALARAGGRLLYAGTEQKRLVLPSYRLAGTPDGLAQWPDGSESVLEIKSHEVAQNYDACPSAMHARQAEMNVELFHETTAHRPDDAILVYVLAENYDRLALHRIERRPAVFIEMIGKANFAFDAASAAAVTAEGASTMQCVICPYRGRCAAALAKAIPKAGTGGLDEATLRSLDRKVAARQRAIEAESEAAQARADIENEIVATLTEGGAKKVKRNGYVVALKASDGEPVGLEIRCA
jgi:hypothetical protein